MKDTVLMLESEDPSTRELLREHYRPAFEHDDVIYRDIGANLPTEPRAAAAQYFSALAYVLQRGGSAMLSNGWLSLPRAARQRLGTARVRLLERAALTLGVVCYRPNGHAGNPPSSTVLPSLQADRLGLLAESVLAIAALQRCKPAGRLGPGAGAWRPGAVALLVADRAQNALRGDLKHRLPLYSFTDGGVALWLAAKLEEAGITEDKLYWINAYDKNGLETDGAFVDALQPKTVIALGTAADKWVDEHCKGVGAWTTVRHPSVQKKYGMHEPYDLIDALQNAKL